MSEQTQIKIKSGDTAYSLRKKYPGIQIPDNIKIGSIYDLPVKKGNDVNVNSTPVNSALKTPIQDSDANSIFAGETPRKDDSYVTPKEEARLARESEVNDAIRARNNWDKRQETGDLFSAPETKSEKENDVKSYLVQSGDTLSKVAEKNNIPVKDLKEINQLKNDKIKVGQKLLLEAKEEKVLSREELTEMVDSALKSDDTKWRAPMKGDERPEEPGFFKSLWNGFIGFFTSEVEASEKIKSPSNAFEVDYSKESEEKGDLKEYFTEVIMRESQGKPEAQNKFGYIGLGQFGVSSLIDEGVVVPKKGDKVKGNNWNSVQWTGKYGVYSKDDFLSNPEAQIKCIINLANRNRKYLATHGAEEYVGKTIKNVPMDKKGTTEDILLDDPALTSMAHLLGARGALNCLKNGEKCHDAFGTSGFEYAKKFGGYTALIEE